MASNVANASTDFMTVSKEISLATHELGHTFGVFHHDGCIMTRGKWNLEFCGKCKKTLEYYLEKTH